MVYRYLFVIMISFWGSIFGASAQKSFTNATVDDFEQMLKKDRVQLLDVRTLKEFADGHLNGSVCIDVYNPEFMKLATAQLKKDRPVAVYCRSGKRSAMAAQQLSEVGYQVTNLRGGILAWIEKKKPVVKE